MASPELAIARTAFLGTLLRSKDGDGPPCSRGQVEDFHRLLDAAVARCSPAHVQSCKHWILDTLAGSPARLAALAKYLAALVRSFAPSPSPSASAPAGDAAGRAKKETSARRKRLHVLYVLNDALYHSVVRRRQDALARALEATLEAIVRSAAAFPNCPKHKRKIEDLLRLWDEKQYFSAEFQAKLREAAAAGERDGEDGGDSKNGSVAKTSADPKGAPKELPFMIPSMHGDASTPWYDLPAGNWMPHMTPNSTRAMNPDMIKPLQFAPGPADKVLENAVRDLLSDVERIFAKNRNIKEGPHTVLNELGERVFLDEITGEVVGGETYYGWSRQFCQKAKNRKKGAAKGAADPERRSRSYSRSVSRSRSSSRTSSRPAPKRRRLSTDSRSRSPVRGRSDSRDRSQGSRSRSRDRSRGRYARRRSPSPSTSRSRSRSRGRYDSRDSRRSQSPWRNRSRGGSRSRERGYDSDRRGGRPYRPRSYSPRSRPASRSPSRSRSRQYGREPAARGFQPPDRGQADNPPYPPPPPSHPNHPIPPVAFPGFPIPPAALAQFPPPPPPPNFQGHWPPPPPPPPGPLGVGAPQVIPPGWYQQQGGPAPPGGAGGWMQQAPPPLPPPPQQQMDQGQGYGHQGQYGQRHGRGGWGGQRGGGYGRYDRGRGRGW